MEPDITRLVQDSEKPFDLKRVRAKRSPVAAFLHVLNAPLPPIRVNHLMLKNGGSRGEIRVPDYLPIGAYRFIKDAIELCSFSRLWDYVNRYIYFTLDSGIVKAGDTLRAAGWRLDGMQGDEVPVKQFGDYQVIWSNAVPTEFAEQKFESKGIDLSVHNVFDRLGKQVNAESVTVCKPNMAYLMGCYHVHRCGVATIDAQRTFMRLNFTRTPVTSVNMTVNPCISYNYKIHTTSGQIPSHLC